MTIENRDDTEYDLVMPHKYVSKEELKKLYPDQSIIEQGVTITTVPKNSDEPNVWKGFKFPMGAFLVWSENGKMAWGKCDPLTQEVIEWNEM